MGSTFVDFTIADEERRARLLPETFSSFRRPRKHAR